MNKKRFYRRMLVLGISFVLILGVSILVIIRNERNKKHPAVRYAENNKDNTTESKDMNRNEASGNTDEGTTEAAIVKLNLPVQNLCMEFESYELVSLQELRTQDRYAAEDFIDQEIPSEDNVMLTYLDRDNLAKESELLNKLYGPGSENIDPSVWMKLYDDNIDEIEPIINKYRYSYHPETLYVFVRAKITPLDSGVKAGERIETNVGGLNVVLVDKDGDYIISDECNFIHNAEYVDTVDRERNFYIFELGSEEEREIIMGYPVYFKMDSKLSIEDSNEYDLFIGSLDFNLMEDGISPIYSESIISIKSLPVEGGE